MDGWANYKTCNTHMAHASDIYIPGNLLALTGSCQSSIHITACLKLLVSLLALLTSAHSFWLGYHSIKYKVQLKGHIGVQEFPDLESTVVLLNSGGCNLST